MKNINKKLICILLAICICVFSACAGGDIQNNKEVLNNYSNEIISTKKIIDCANIEVEVPAECKKIICVWPSGTQLLVALGLGDLLVGVSEDSKEQSWALEMYPKLSEITSCSKEESAESLLDLDADIVLTTESDIAENWRNKGVTAITFKYYYVDEMKNAILTLSEIIPEKYSEKCKDYISYLNENMLDVANKLGNLDFEKQSVYYIHGNNNKGLYKTAGKDTMNEEWALAAYTDFATSTLLSSSETNVNAEAILDKNPDVIVIGGKYQKRLYDELITTDEWSDINAVVNNKIFTIPYGISPFDRFGAEFAIMIPWLASTVYPDKYVFDINTEIKEFYNRFTDVNLSNEQVNYIINGLGPNGTEDIKYE